MPLRGRRQQRKRVITDSDSDDGDDTPAPSRKRVQKQRTSTDQDIEIEDDVSDDFSDEPDYTAFYAALFPSSKAQHLPLKSDHADRPLYVCPDRRVILEAWSPLYTQAQDFLIAISEPISRPKLMHEFKITEFSLCAAVSVGLDSTSILSVLSKLSKTPLPESVEEFITEKTESFGKLKLVLREGEFWVESRFERVVKRVLQDETVASCRVVNTVQSSATADLIGMEDLALVREQVRVEEPFQHAGQTNRTTGQDESGSLITDEQSQKEIANGGSHNMQEFGAELEGIDLFQLFEDDWDDSAAVPPMAPPIPVQEPDVSLSNSVSFVSTLDEQDQPALNYLSNNGSSPLFGSVITLDALEDADTDDTQHQNSPSSRTSQNYTYSFQIKKESVSLLRQRCSELNYPLLDEYDFRRDTRLPVLDADLKPSTKLRPYQEEGLSKMFSSGRGRSGVIVLPCGAGKTLVGVTAACTVKKSCLVLCTSK